MGHFVAWARTALDDGSFEADKLALMDQLRDRLLAEACHALEPQIDALAEEWAKSTLPASSA